MKSNDEVMILIKIREQKEEISRLKDKVEVLQDKIDKIKQLYQENEIVSLEEAKEIVLEISSILKGE